MGDVADLHHVPTSGSYFFHIVFNFHIFMIWDSDPGPIIFISIRHRRVRGAEHREK